LLEVPTWHSNARHFDQLSAFFVDVSLIAERGTRDLESRREVDGRLVARCRTVEGGDVGAPHTRTSVVDVRGETPCWRDG
jgi:hypothetical protein